MPIAKKTPAYGKRDLRDVSDTPELTAANFARARPFADAPSRSRRIDPEGTRSEQGPDRDRRARTVTHSSRNSCPAIPLASHDPPEVRKPRRAT